MSTTAQLVDDAPPLVRATLDPVADQTVKEGDTLTLTAHGQGSGLTYALDLERPAGATIDPKAGVFTYTPGKGPGAYTVTVRVTDNDVPPSSDTRTFTITVLNVAPTVGLGPTILTTPGKTVTSLGSFTDPGVSDSWTATVNYGDGSGDQTLPLSADKTFTLTHTYTTVGSYSVTVSVTDAGMDSGTATLQVFVRPYVRLAYVIPSDRSPQPNGVAEIRENVAQYQAWFRDQMERYGFASRSFAVETEDDGVTPRVWVVQASHPAEYFQSDIWGRAGEAIAQAGLPLWAPGMIWLTYLEDHVMSLDGSIKGGGSLGGGGGSGLDGGVAAHRRRRARGRQHRRPWR